MIADYQHIFNQRGASYHQAMMLYPQARDQEFHEILRLAEPRPGQVLCDAPSGGGYLLDYLPTGAHTIIALETSAAFHGFCEQRGCCHCVLSSMQKIDLPDASVDCVISLAGLHHLQDRDAFFQEAYRILKPGGNCCVADVAEKSSVAHFLNDFVHQHNSMGHQGLFFDERAPNELEAAGFSISSSFLKNYHWQFASPDAMSSYVRLLFGLDRATPQQVLHGIKSYLGWKQVPDACLMNWGLFFMKGIKPA